MRSLSGRILGLIASPLGLLILAALDSTLFFSLPGGIDAAVLLVAVRRQTPWWLVALLATAGSVGGAALTFWMGIKIGEHSLDRYIPRKRLTRIRRKANEAGAIGLAVLDLIPPPFPFTPFILAAGALEVDTATFFATLTVCRLIRFGGEALLAIVYGRRILAWLDSNAFLDVVVVVAFLGAALTALSIVKLYRSSRGRVRSRRAA
jgi:membrane protein YqaA with SNARE-associated domain